MTKVPGYFWNLSDRKLYSIKSGELKPIKPISSYAIRNCGYPPGYQISHKGKRKVLSLSYLETLRYTDEIEFINYASVS